MHWCVSARAYRFCSVAQGVIWISSCIWVLRECVCVCVGVFGRSLTAQYNVTKAHYIKAFCTVLLRIFVLAAHKKEFDRCALLVLQSARFAPQKLICQTNEILLFIFISNAFALLSKKKKKKKERKKKKGEKKELRTKTETISNFAAPQRSTTIWWLSQRCFDVLEIFSRESYLIDFNFFFCLKSSVSFWLLLLLKTIVMWMWMWELFQRFGD